MYPRSIVLALLAAVIPGCKSVDCGDGTTERNGLCVAPSETVSAAKCGDLTELHGDTCVPKFPPTTCDPSTTAEEIDPSTGVTTCVGTGASGCAARLACPAGTGGNQTICGQLYDFETGQPFAAPSATGAQCGTGVNFGPCALGFNVSNAALALLTTGPVYIDDCGRFRIPDVGPPGTVPLIVLAVDDVAQPGPMGLANPAGVAVAAMANGASRDVEAFVVKPSTITGWSGPSPAAGIFALVFHSKLTGLDLASGVTVTKNGVPDAPNTRYFGSTAANRTTLDSNAHVTGVNGTAFYIAQPAQTDMYSGTGALPSGCNWDAHPAAAVPGVVFIQTFRPTGSTCPP